MAAGATVNMGSAGTANPTGVAVLVPSNGMLTGTKQILDAPRPPTQPRSASPSSAASTATAATRRHRRDHLLRGGSPECDTTTIPGTTPTPSWPSPRTRIGITVSPRGQRGASRSRTTTRLRSLSRLHVANHQLSPRREQLQHRHAQGLQRPGSQSKWCIFNWAQQDHDDMYTLGARICRSSFSGASSRHRRASSTAAALAPYDKAIEPRR